VITILSRLHTLASSLPVVDNNEPVLSCPNFNLADWNSLSFYLKSEFLSCATASDMWSKFTDIVFTDMSCNVPNCNSLVNSRTRRC
jgi:hypothetical protein